MPPTNDNNHGDTPPDHLNPFRVAERKKRDQRDRAHADIREQIEPVPDVICIQCTDQPVMDYQRQMSTPQPDADTPLIEATWECPACNGLAYGYVTQDGLTPILDNARPAADAADE